MKLRVSFSLLSMWRQGRVSDCVNYYFKLKQLTNPYMEIGKEWDEKVNTCVRETQQLPPEFGSDSLRVPKVQEKWEADFEGYRLVGVPDVVDQDTLYEIKTGTGKDSSDYAMDFQVGMYLLLGELLGKGLKKALILHYNQRSKELDKTLIWDTPFERERARNFIQTLAPEIFSYFSENNLFAKYGIDSINKDMLL